MEDTRQLSLPLSPSSGDRPAASRGDAASGASRLVDALAAFCREHPLEEKVVVMPDRIVGRQVTDAAARLLSPGGWINLRVETVGTLAHAIAGAGVAAEGRTTLSRAQRVAIVEKICADVLEDASYFGAIRFSPGFHRALARTIDEIRASGIDPRAIAPASLEDARKSVDLTALLAAYEVELGRAFVDGPGILRRALAALARGEAPKPPWVLVPDRPALSGAETEMLRRFAGDRLVSLPTDDPDGPASAEFRFRRAVGEENELRDVFRRALAESIPFDRIEILYTDRSTYLSLAYELARQYEIPATFVDRIDAAYTRPGRAVLGFLDWVRSDFGERELRDLLTTGALDVGKLSGSPTLTGAGAARILRSAKIGWGRPRYSSCLDALAARPRHPSGGPSEAEEPPDRETEERRRRDVAAVRRLVDALFSAVPVSSASESVPLRALAGSCADVVREFARSASELDGVAGAAIPPLLEDLGFLGDRPVPVREAAGRIREAIAELFVGGSGITYPQPGMVHVAGYESGGYTGRPYTFIVGLDESRHPGAGLQDPVLLDGERRRVNAAAAPAELALRGDAPRERGAALRATVARLRGIATFSYSCHDLAEDREQFPAAILVDLFRSAAGDPEADSASLAAAAGPPAGYFAPEAPLDASEWWLTALRNAGRTSGGRRAVLRAHSWLEAGETAREARRSEEFTAWDGAVASAGASLDPRESGEPMSASRLQLLADCPFAYFLRYVLRVEPPEEVVRDEAAWLSPSESGRLLHEVFRRFMAEGEETGSRFAARTSGRLAEIADAAIEEWKREIPPPNDAALERQRSGIRSACETFLRGEAREAGRVSPRHFEIAFGYADRAPDPVLGDARDLSIPVGRGRAIRVRGSIDRVDVAGDGSFEIWDYKTGSAWAYDPTKGIDGGRRIQHALYAAAFEEMLRRAGTPGRVARAGYFFTGARSDGRREDFGWEVEEFRETLGRLCDVLRSGAFLHAIDPKNGCAFCPYTSICGGRERGAEAAARKLFGSGASALAPLAALGWSDA